MEISPKKSRMFNFAFGEGIQSNDGAVPSSQYISQQVPALGGNSEQLQASSKDQGDEKQSSPSSSESSAPLS